MYVFHLSINGINFIKMEFVKDFVDIDRLSKFNGLFFLVLLYFEAYVNYKKSKRNFCLNMLYYLAIFGYYYIDIIDKNTNYWAI